MKDEEFYDFVYAGWGKTTGAESMFWMYEDAPSGARLYAVDQNQTQHLIGHFRNENDAAFVTALHGAIPDMTRQLLDLTDENDRLDTEKDSVISELAQAYLREQELMKEIESLKAVLEEYEGAEDG